MHFGGAMFFTDYSMSAPELARALEERGFESVWAPEHSHIPLSRKTPFPGGGNLPKPYYDAMDPGIWAPMMVPGAEHFREIANKLREAAAACQFAGDQKEILHLAARFEAEPTISTTGCGR